MNNQVRRQILNTTGAQKISFVEEIQPLWNNYGTLSRIYLAGSQQYPSVILKHIQIPQYASHPRGFASSFSKQRKIKSYQVETHWYQNYNQHIAETTTSPTPDACMLLTAETNCFCCWKISPHVVLPTSNIVFPGKRSPRYSIGWHIFMDTLWDNPQQDYGRAEPTGIWPPVPTNLEK